MSNPSAGCNRWGLSPIPIELHLKLLGFRLSGNRIGQIFIVQVEIEIRLEDRRYACDISIRSPGFGREGSCGWSPGDKH